MLFFAKTILKKSKNNFQKKIKIIKNIKKINKIEKMNQNK